MVALYPNENEIVNRLKTILVLGKLKMKQGLGIRKITLHSCHILSPLYYLI